MKARIYVAVAALLSAAALTSVAQEQAPRDTTNTTRPTNPTTQPGTQPGTTTPGTTTQGTLAPWNTSMSEAEVLGVIACIDSNEINAARLIVGNFGATGTGTDPHRDMRGGTGTTDDTDLDSQGDRDESGDVDRDDTDRDDGNPGDTSTNDESGGSGGTYDGTTTPGYGKTTQGGTADFQKKNVSDEVREYAEMMVREHGAHLQKTMELGREAGVQPSFTGERVRMLKQKGKQDLTRLQPLTGREFERAFVTVMINGHRDALQILDNELIPSVKDNQELRQHLTQTRAAVAKHYAEAQQLQTQISMGN
jgi:predicted outer membrane protein